MLLFLGINYLDSNKLDKAREVLSKGVALYPKDVQMRFHLGMTEDRLGHFDLFRRAAMVWKIAR